MTNIAILGFGIVGNGVAEMIAKNSAEIKKTGGEEINIKYILDLKDFPDSPFADKVIHDYDVILNDKSISIVVEVMGGSHPAYEYTVSALKAGKSVVTSNKEVVANFGDEFLALAKENGVSYRFEAAVGGGIPVISPIITCVAQNKIREVRGILNGTTNYILTKMFSFGDSFESALADAQARGYAEANPDADVLGLDAARKIVILAALVTGSLVSPDNIHTEGITKIRKADVLAVGKIGASIKLVGRCICSDSDAPYLLVAPFVISNDSPLSTVCGVYNAIEVVGEPIANVMFYGRGAGAGPTASAVVGDVVQTVVCTDIGLARFEKSEKVRCFADFKCKNYFAFDKSAKTSIESVFGNVDFIDSDECAFITDEMSEAESELKIKELSTLGFSPLSKIRLLQ